MLLRYMRIENFRGFERVELDLDETTVLIGENNCGKTSLLEAIRMCLSRSFSRKGTPFEDHDYHPPRTNARPGDAGALKIL
jgi:putative ATP-dependent endonuclease of the OLD family